MGIFRRSGRHSASEPTGDSVVADVTAAVDYDAQSDLALPMNEQQDTVDAFVPFAGEMVPEGPQAGYDTDRDVGL